MRARLQAKLTRLTSFLLGLSPARRLLVIGAGVGAMIAVLAVAWWIERPLYRPLFTHLSTGDAGAIVAVLEAENVPFHLDDGGRAVLVPAERLYELRLALASRGLPEAGGIGFEGVDAESGVTDFVRRLDYQRALQGELARTIGGLGGVESARVQLGLPERPTLGAQDRRPSASVVVKLAAGRKLGRAQIDGVVHLVASSVAGLDADAVTVVDESGRMLTADRSGAEEAGVSSSGLEMQSAIERQLVDRIETMLGAVVGRDKTIARVAASLDLARFERTEETYDPDRTALKTQRATREPIDAATSDPDRPRTERRDDRQTYEVSRVVSRTVAPAGALKQLSVAVLVDGVYSGEGGKRVFAPRSQEEMDRLRELVKGAVGFSDVRGDKIELACVPFQTDPAPAGEGVLRSATRWMPTVVVRLLAVAFGVIVLLYVVRPIVLAVATRPAPSAPGSPGAAAAAETDSARLTRETLALTRQHPERAAQLVREWLHEDGVTLATGD